MGQNDDRGALQFYGSEGLLSDEILADWMDSLSVNTRRAYGRDLSAFAAFLGLSSPEAAVRSLIGAGKAGASLAALRYRTAMEAEGLAPATINRRLAALRAAVTFARRLGAAGWDLDVRGLRAAAYRDTRGPGLDGSRAIWQVMAEAGDSKKACRDRAIFRLLWDLGLRRAEVASLDLEHVDLEAAELEVLGKGTRDRQRLALPAETVTALRTWIDERGEGPGALFVALDRAHAGHRLTGSAIYGIVRAVAERAGLSRLVSPHRIRHASITARLDLSNGNVRAAAAFSRHASLATLTRYDDNRRDEGGALARAGAALL